MTFDPSVFDTATATFNNLVAQFEALLTETVVHVDPEQNWKATAAGTIYVLDGALSLLNAAKTSFTNLAAIDPMSGAGSPEGVVVANPGTLYCNTDGTTGATPLATLWVKESGTGATGWVGK